MSINLIKQIRRTLASLPPDYTAQLDTMQLSLYAAWRSQQQPLIILKSGSSAAQRQLQSALTAWNSFFQLPDNWHLLTNELSEPEKTGSITTSFSTALHCLLLQQPHHHFVIDHRDIQHVPDPARYQASTIHLTVGEQLTPDFITHLIKRGYRRYTQSLEPGGFRLRGELIDIAHPALAGHFTITLHGRIIERITHTEQRRAIIQPRLALPPMQFPDTIVPLANILSAYTVLRPDTSRRQPFPWQPLTNQADVQETVIFYENRDRIQKYIADQHLKKATLLTGPLAHIPLRLRHVHTALLSEAALFPASATVTQLSATAAATFLSQLTVGRPAVHSDHGIGLYEGLVTRTISDRAHEYLILRYAEGDTLSVPVELAYKVTPYLGAAAPSLHRLGGTAWAKTKKAATADAIRFAQELLAIAKERHRSTRPPHDINPALEETIEKTFAYELTPDQQTTWEEVARDLQQNQPMDRLLVGDVGFGKTEIAARAARHVVANGYQVALLAPTTLLVQQHTDLFRQRFPELSEKIGSLSRATSSRERAATLRDVSDGTLRIIVGTHALLSAPVTWPNLGLIIIDEEQRFGVRHKEHFKKLRAATDVLSLSATPIPRTLSQALTGLRQLSVISTPPPGRKSVATNIGPDADQTIQQAIQFEMKRDGQSYVVAPKIQQLSSLAYRLHRLIPSARVGLLHGQLPDRALARTMQQFDNGELDVLLSSSIIEHGLDLPKANTLIVTHCTHFGLSDLYQLRGRIGRRATQAHAYFLYHQQELTPVQRARLTALTETARLGAGWEIARRDLEIRGAGNLLGAEQSGFANTVGVPLYLDLVREAAEPTRHSSASRRSNLDIQLPLTALLPTHYMADLDERTRWYLRLSRATEAAALIQQVTRMQKIYGPLPEEAKNLVKLLHLQHAAAAAGIHSLATQTITPPDKPKHERLLVTGQNLPNILHKLADLGPWTVRGSTLTLDVPRITIELVERLTRTLG